MSLEVTIEVEVSGEKTTRVKVPLHAIDAASGDAQVDGAAIFTAQVLQSTALPATDQTKAIQNNSSNAGDTPSTPPATSGTNITLWIFTTTGKMFSIKATTGETVREVKSSIQDHESIPLGQQALLFRGRRLENQRTLGDYGIDDGAAIHIIRRGWP